MGEQRNKPLKNKYSVLWYSKQFKTPMLMASWPTKQLAKTYITTLKALDNLMLDPKWSLTKVKDPIRTKERYAIVKYSYKVCHKPRAKRAKGKWHIHVVNRKTPI